MAAASQPPLLLTLQPPQLPPLDQLSAFDSILFPATDLPIGLRPCSLDRHVSTLDLSSLDLDIDCLAPICRIFARLSTLHISLISFGETTPALPESLDWPTSLTSINLYSEASVETTVNGVDGLPLLLARLPTSLRSLTAETVFTDDGEGAFDLTPLLLRFHQLEHVHLGFSIQNDERKLFRAPRS
jgi:hypothetical protein